MHVVPKLRILVHYILVLVTVIIRVMSTFYRAALNAGWSSHEKAVCPSVKRVHCDERKETSIHILIPHERSFILLSDKKNG